MMKKAMEAKVASSNHLGVGYERKNEKTETFDAHQSKPGGDHKPVAQRRHCKGKRRALN